MGQEVSITVFDIQAAALMNRSTAKVQLAAEQIRELFIFTMLTDVELQDTISRRTGSTSQTKIRWSRFRDLASPIIDGTLVEPRFFSYPFREELWRKSHTCLLCNNEIHSFEDCTVTIFCRMSKAARQSQKTVNSHTDLVMQERMQKSFLWRHLLYNKIGHLSNKVRAGNREIVLMETHRPIYED